MAKRPKTTVSGCLSDNQRDFLLTPPGERIKKFGDDNTVRSYDRRIKKRIRQCVKDLALIAYALDEKNLEKYFEVREMSYLLKIITAKIGRNQTQFGPYYQLLIDAVRGGINTNMSTTKEVIEIHVIQGLLSGGGYGGVPDNRDTTSYTTKEFLKLFSPENEQGS
jgi:hypothetical protein